MYTASQLMQFLMGHHESFDKEKSQLLMMDPLQDLEKAFSMLFAVEQQRSIHTHVVENNVTAAYQVFFKQNKGPPQKQIQRRRMFQDKRGMICTHCHKQGHLRETCFQLHGTLEWYKALNDKKKEYGDSYRFAGNLSTKETKNMDITAAKTDTKANIADLMKELLRMMKSKENSSDPISEFASYVNSEKEFAGNASTSAAINLGDWIFDSGATNHVCAHFPSFVTYSARSHTHFVHLPDGSKKTVVYIGTVRLSNELVLDSVHYILDFPVNLLSISQLCNGNRYSCSFNQFECVVQDQETKMGHASISAIRHIPESNISSDSMEMKCEICPKAKQSRVPFLPSDSHATAIFELVHLDVWGPYKTPSLSGSHYVLTVLDDHSRSLWTYLIKHKVQVASTLRFFVAMVETQFGTKIKVLHSDNGSEFVNVQCQNLCQKSGIIHQTSCVYTPQQNGRIERRHWQLLNIARALLFHVALPLKFWGESILATTYIINRTPSAVLGWQTPFSVLLGCSPTYNHFKIFACLSFATNLNPHKTKFQKRAHRCVFLGYSMMQKGYRVYDLEDHVLFTSRDVVFHERVFPFAQGQISGHVDCPLPLIPVGSNVEDSARSHTAPSMCSPSLTAAPLDDAEITPIDSALQPQSSLRRSSGISQRPQWLNDFVCQHNASFLHSSSATYASFVASLNVVQEPRSFAEAALERNNTWRSTPLPAGKRAIGCNIKRYKGRLDAKGFNQIEGIDFTESFSPVAKAITVRVFLTLTAANGWVFHQLDVNNAFLHRYLDEDIYMMPPAGYKVGFGLVCKLERSLYGLKQTLGQWNVELTLKLQEFGFVQSAHDYCLFLLHTDHGLVSLLVYVDDILLAGANIHELDKVKSYLHDLFTIKDIGEARYFLGLEIARNTEGIYLAQTKYVLDIVGDTGLSHAKAVPTPFPPGLKLSSDTGALLSAPDCYRHLIRRLLYLSFTRPDISHSLQGYCDADWASCPDSKRSLTGFCIFLGDALVSWNTKKQTIVTRSTAEAEYRSLATMVCELRWLSYLLADFGVDLSLPISLYYDNKAALYIHIIRIISNNSLIFHFYRNQIFVLVLSN
ncbi:UNVERIFIED_CONTAM: Retrovirus-related Pol polyprotein from transposon RE1 [Sesamum indicum]